MVSENIFINMSRMMICIVLFLLNANLSVAQFYIRTPTNVTQKRILLSFNTDSIPACFQKCKETPCCKDIATVKDKDKKSFECYLLRSHETNDDAEERLVEVNLTRSITVSFLTFYVLILREFKEKFHIEKVSQPFYMFEKLANIFIKKTPL